MRAPLWRAWNSIQTILWLVIKFLVFVSFVEDGFADSALSDPRVVQVGLVFTEVRSLMVFFQLTCQYRGTW